jgi:hypothetical protein
MSSPAHNTMFNSPSYHVRCFLSVLPVLFMAAAAPDIDVEMVCLASWCAGIVVETYCASAGMPFACITVTTLPH